MKSSSSSAVSLLLFAWLSSKAYSQFIPGDLCRCQAEWENFYSERLRRHLTQEEEGEIEKSSIVALRSLQELDPVTGLYVVDGIFVLPNSDPKCSTSVPFRTGAGGAYSSTAGGATTYSAPQYHGGNPDPDVFGERDLMIRDQHVESDTTMIVEYEDHNNKKDPLQRHLQDIKYHGTQPGEPPQTSQTISEVTTRGARPYGTRAYVARPDYGKGE
jgi:hypothetical protein